MLVAAADKFYNARAMVGDLRAEGAQFWQRFNTGADDQIWYYRGVVDALRQNWAHRIVDELEQVVRELEALSRIR